MPGVLDCSPNGFEKQPLARIHRDRFTWGNTKERCVKFVDPVNKSPLDRWIRRNLADPFPRKFANSILTGKQVLPEGFDVGRSRETSVDADNGDRLRDGLGRGNLIKFRSVAFRQLRSGIRSRQLKIFLVGVARRNERKILRKEQLRMRLQKELW